MTRKEIRSTVLANLLDASSNINAAIDWMRPLREKSKAVKDIYIAKNVLWRAYWAIEKKK